jgi:hypothetical protein
LNLANFDVASGELLGGAACDSLKSYPVRIVNGNIVVNVAEEDFEAPCRGRVPVMARPDGSDPRTFVVIGTGAGGMACAESLRRGGFLGRIVLLTKNEEAPIDRTLLCKTTKDDPATFAVRPLSFFNEFGIELRRNTAVKTIKEDTKEVVLESGEKIGYDKVCVATGWGYTIPKSFDTEVKTLKNVQTLDSVADYELGRANIARARSIVFLSSGAISDLGAYELAA